MEQDGARWSIQPAIQLSDKRQPHARVNRDERLAPARQAAVCQDKRRQDMPLPTGASKLPSPPMSSQTSGGEAGPPRRVKQKTILEEVTVTFSSPAAWLLVAALVLTWTAVAVVVLDLLDYQTLAGVPPPPAIARRGLKANRGGVRSMGSSCVGGAAPPPSPQASADWLEMMWTFAASLVAPDEEEEEVEGIQQLTQSLTYLHWEEL
ncbi:uncharacterized protein LOC144039680 isoform X5 [Vanacampus margaritifer]